MGRPPKEIKNEVEKDYGPNKDFQQLMKEMEKTYNVKRASDIEILPKIKTGVYALDYVLSGGVCQCEGGHKIEFCGKESSGKTLMALKIIAKFQSLKKNVVYLNVENSYDPEWAAIQGVDNETLLTIKPTSLEEAGDLLVKLIPKSDLIVLDSIAMLQPMEEGDTEKTFEDKHMASQAKVLSPICRAIQATYKDYKCVIIFINQVREKVGISYGNPEVSPGGHALKHLYDTQIYFRPGQPIYVGTGDNKERIGNEITLVNKKNKKGKPFRQAVVDFYLTGNIDNSKSVFFAGLKYMVIKREGNTYTYKNLKAVGQDAFKELLKPEILAEIETELEKLEK
jgi:recombination protein RecA